ncbi:MAG: acetylxylan esterase [Lachnospiraceae bacterium]|nr:acetylxylan esterase [Lachnospiraceae bacterium]MDO4939656.1 acetylxylan esterase [Lachnospiraceae bacterium]
MKVFSADGKNLEELEAYYGSEVEAADFDGYWDRAKTLLDDIDPDVKLEKAEFECRSADCYKLSFNGVGGARVTAKYLRPKTPGPHPCVLWFHGYTIASMDWTMYLHFIAEGMCVAALDCRGEGSDSRDCVQNPQAWIMYGLIMRGMREGADQLAFRRIYLDTLELAQIVEKFPEVDADAISTYGTSQGGALSVACSALHGGIKKTVCGSNFLSDFPYVIESNYHSVENPGSPYSEIGQYFRRYDHLHENVDEMLETLSYIDCVNFAKRVKNPVLMEITLQDRFIPPASQFAVFNNFAGPKEKVIYYDYNHEDALPGWIDRAMTFLKK